MNKILSFYVYEHRRADNGEVFYIGKGSRTKKKAFGRAYSTENRNRYWNNIVNKHGFTAHILCEFDKECDAFSMEIDLINKYGNVFKSGRLCNMTNGGEGACGRVMSDRTKQIKRLLWLGEKGYWYGKVGPNKGISLSIETRLKISESNKGRASGMKGKTHGDAWRKSHSMLMSGGNHPKARKVIDDRTGVVYDCIKNAAIAFGVSKSAVQFWLNGRRNNPTSLRYL